MTVKYKALADKIIADIACGQLSMDQRMPSLRKFKILHDVSMTTANNCYQRLVSLGWLRAVAQSGYFISKPFNEYPLPHYPQFSAQATHYTRQTLHKLGSEIEGPFCRAQLSAKLLPQQQLAQCLRRASKKSEDRFFDYPDAQGEGELRHALAHHFSHRHFALDAQQLVITNGCLDAVRSAIEVTTKVGDCVAVSSPCFNGLLTLLQSMKRRIVEISCYQSQLDLQQLTQLLQQQTISACLFSANHINPQGFCLSNEQKKSIADLAHRYRVPVIEDDIYLELSYNNNRQLPIKYWDKQGWVLWCSSISKTISASYRLGWCEPGRYFSDYHAHRRAQYMGVNTMTQLMLQDFIHSGQYAKHLKKLNHQLGLQAQHYQQLLRQHLPKQTQISIAQGGLVIWIQLAGLDSHQLLEKAVKNNTPFRVGSDFTTRDYYKNCLRINIGHAISVTSAHSLQGDHDAMTLKNKLIRLCELISDAIEAH